MKTVLSYNFTGKTILIFTEQGIGDIFQFSRYIYELHNVLKARVILRLKHNLFHFYNLKGIRTISENEKIPKHELLILNDHSKRILYMFGYHFGAPSWAQLGSPNRCAAQTEPERARWRAAAKPTPHLEFDSSGGRWYLIYRQDGSY